MEYDLSIITGSPRSGKTLLQSLLARTGNHGWVSQYYARYPFQPSLVYLNRIYDMPLIGEAAKKRMELKWMPHPAEFPKKISDTLSNIGSLEKSDVTQKDKDLLLCYVRNLSIYSGRRILVLDEGRPARINYFKEIFPKSKFIHVIRDGRYVAWDFVNTRNKWFTGKQTLRDFYPTGVETLNKELDKWKSSDEFLLILAAYRWKAAVREIERQKKSLKNDGYLEVRYEDLVLNPNNELARVFQFIGGNEAIFDKKKFNYNLYNPKPLKELYNSKQLKILNKVLHGELSEFGYI